MTAFISDERMMTHRNLFDPLHIEVPARLKRPLELLKSNGILERCKMLDSRAATEEEVRAVHTKEYIAHIRSTRTMNESQLRRVSELYEDIYLCADTYDCALLSAGCALRATETIMKREANNAFALIRPPGHHASADRPCGFCIFNNVAICAKAALDRWGANKVLIIDWDVHAAQGTQYVIQNDPCIKLISIHRFDNGEFWPNTHESNWDTIGNTINVPLNRVGMDDSDYLYIFDQLILPVYFDFAPDLVLISAGYDAALGDPQGEMRLSATGYAQMTATLMAATNGKNLVALYEGGYFIDSVEQGVLATMRVLLNEAPPPLQEVRAPRAELVDVIRHLSKKHAPHLNCCAVHASAVEKYCELTKKEPFEFFPVAPFDARRVMQIPHPLVGLYPPRPPEVLDGYSSAVRRHIDRAQWPKRRLDIAPSEDNNFSTAECDVLSTQDGVTIVNLSAIFDCSATELYCIFHMGVMPHVQDLASDNKRFHVIASSVQLGIYCCSVITNRTNCCCTYSVASLDNADNKLTTAQIVTQLWREGVEHKLPSFNHLM